LGEGESGVNNGVDMAKIRKSLGVKRHSSSPIQFSTVRQHGTM
jgi:hypothetical protein